MIPKAFGFIFQVLLLVLALLIVTPHYGAQASTKYKVTNVGVIIDFDSRIGREQKVAMEASARSFNDSSDKQKLLLHFQGSGSDALKSASLVEKMIKENKVQAIVGMNTWQEAALVGKIGSQAQVPVISLAAPSTAPPQMQLRWPFLVTMASEASAEIRCITDLVGDFQWRKVVVIYEDDEYNGDSGTLLSLLYEALNGIGAEIEYRLVLPPYSTLNDPKGFVLDELAKLLHVQSRAFVVLRSSLDMVNHLYREAKKLGLLERDSAWIVSESVATLLNYVDDGFVVPLMKGTLGIKTYYSRNTSSYQQLQSRFQRVFGEKNHPGIHAVRAYDSIQVIAQALERTKTGDTRGKVLLENILSVSFDGASDNVSFREGKLVDPRLQIINIIGGEDKEPNQPKITYKELNYWTLSRGFSESLEAKEAKIVKSMNRLVGKAVWPGDLYDRNPKGWAMPTIRRPLKIGVPGKTQFSKFVTVDESKKHLNEGYNGLCIRVFNMVLPCLDYDLPYEFQAFYGTYDELVEAVYNKTFDAAVGDITILANRLKVVEFSQPYLESGLAMVTPIKHEESGWIFVKPFTWDVWTVTFGIFVYTMIIVWFLEHPTNPEFSGTVKNQIGTTLWFTFSSLFFAQRERIHSNVTKVAVTIWLFLVFILTASYTASLSSVLTVRQLEPDVTIEWLKSSNQKIGCDPDSFIRKYLEGLGFKAENIYTVQSEYAYVDWFAKKNITAAFLEQPYEKVFLNENCNKYTSSARTYRFGGLGFAFQKGSPIAKDVSDAILKLSENGNITSLEKQCLSLNECAQSNIATGQTESLSIKSFWGIYVISGATSTICFFISLVRLRNNFRRHQQMDDHDKLVKNAVGLARYFYKSQAAYSPRGAATTIARRSSTKLKDIRRSSTWESLSASDATLRHDDVDTSVPAQIEIALQTNV